MDFSYSVIVPTLNAEAEIGGLLGIVLAQDPAPSEVLIVDSSSEDRTAEVAASFKGVRVEVIAREAFDHGGTRHDALMETSGEFVCFLTQDAIPLGTGYIASLLEPFKDPTIAMSTGRQVAKPWARPFERLVREERYPRDSFVARSNDLELLGSGRLPVSDVCSAYRRDDYLTVGGFYRPLSTNEDMLVAAAFLRAGMGVAYAAGAVVLHSHNLSPRQQYARNYQIGRFLAEHGDELGSSGELGEGVKLVTGVSRSLIMERRLAELAAFGVDCAARLLGNCAGRHAASAPKREL